MQSAAHILSKELILAHAHENKNLNCKLKNKTVENLISSADKVLTNTTRESAMLNRLNILACLVVVDASIKIQLKEKKKKRKIKMNKTNLTIGIIFVIISSLLIGLGFSIFNKQQFICGFVTGIGIFLITTGNDNKRKMKEGYKLMKLNATREQLHTIKMKGKCEELIGRTLEVKPHAKIPFSYTVLIGNEDLFCIPQSYFVEP